MRLFLLLIMFIGAHTTGPGDDPAAAVAGYLDALAAGEYATGAALVCENERAALDPDAFHLPLDGYDDLTYTADLSGLEYSVRQQGESWAVIDVTGSIVLDVDVFTEPVTVTAGELGLAEFWPVLEDDRWTVCSAPPPVALRELDPDHVARLFIQAAFAGDYDQAQSVICEDQRGQLTPDQFQQMYGDLLDQGFQIDLSAAEFEITAQNDDTATVTLGGRVGMSWNDRPRPVFLPAERLNFRPIHLVIEEGWKVCDPSS